MNTKLTPDEVGQYLRRLYDRAPHQDKMFTVHLFGVQYGQQLKTERITAKAIIERGQLPRFGVALNAGMKLSGFVELTLAGKQYLADLLPPPDFADIGSIILEKLRDVAAKRGLIHYSEINSLVNLAPHSPDLAQLLGKVSRADHQAGRPLLSAIVVRQSNGRPGEGFFRMARHIGAFRGDDDEDFWMNEVQRVYDYWSEAPGHRNRMADYPSDTQFGDYEVADEPPDATRREHGRLGGWWSRTIAAFKRLA